MHQMSVKAKLSAVVALFAVALLMTAAIGLWDLRETNGRFESTYNDRVVPLEQLKVVSDMYAVNIVDTAHKTRDGAVSWKQAARNIAEARKQILGKWNAYMATTLTEEEKKLADAASANMKKADQAVEKLAQLVTQENHDGLAAFAAREMYPVIDPVTDAVSKLVDLQLRVAKEEFNDSMASYRNTLIVFGILVVAALLIGTLVSTAIIRQLVNELGGEPSTVAAIAHAISEGRLDTRITVREGDSTSVIASCKLMQERMRDVIGEIISATHVMSSAATQLLTSANLLSTGTETQSNSTANMAASVEQLSASVALVSDHARQGNDLATQSNDLSLQGGDVIGQATSGILSIVDRVQTTADEITRLGQESETISNVVQVIKEVADQTNLLALNAAIEAARAGEQGRGFAVVADEVRKLAERTTSATGEISQLIGAIQHSAKAAVSSMTEVAQEVQVGSSHAASAGRSIGEITEMSGKVLHVVKEISSALSEQSTACGDIARNVEQVAQMAEENSAATTEVAQSAQVLNDIAGRLDRSVAIFRL